MEKLQVWTLKRQGKQQMSDACLTDFGVTANVTST